MQALDFLIQSLQRLPGVGQKSAQRMAYHLLQHDQAGAKILAQALNSAIDSVDHCSVCYTFCQGSVCPTCLDPKRDGRKICVVQTPADQAAIESTGGFRGLYFVLQGALSPLDGVGPAQIGLHQLLERVERDRAQFAEDFEVIVATNFTAQGEMTAHVIAEKLNKMGVKNTRLARGVPAGSELEYVDLSTIAYAFAGRR